MNQKQNQPVASRPSKKRKNTYVIRYSAFADPHWFADCAITYNQFSHIMTADELKLASTIVEYLDKETGEPIAYLYPNCDIVSEQYDTLPKLMARLNHATRQDLMRQHSKRSNMWNIIKVRGRTK